MTKVFFMNMHLRDVDLSGANFSGPPETVFVMFSNCNLSHASFSNGLPIGFQFHKCNMTWRRILSIEFDRR